jgi:uncharacterized integral membrane protein (TIGR00697 family)
MKPEQTHFSNQKVYRYYNLILVAFVTLLLCANLIGAQKVCQVAGITFSGTLIFFPITYLLGDILTEVYGYKQSRKVVWAGFIAMIYASGVAWLVLSLPASPGWIHQEALETVFRQTPRLVIGSLIAYLIGEFSNSYVLAKMKIMTRGKWLWSRIIGSTVIGEGVDTLIFYPLAFYQVWPNALLSQVMMTSYLFKVIWEISMIPFTYRVVSFLKKSENEDYFDEKTHFSPFSRE